MTDAASDPEPLGIRPVMTRAVWPLAIAVPLLPILVGVIAYPPGSSDTANAFLGGLAGLQLFMLAGTLIAARLLETQWSRSGTRLVSRRQSWALMVITVCGVAYPIGVATVIGPASSIGFTTIVHAAFGIFVAVAALAVLALRVIRASAADD